MSTSEFLEIPISSGTNRRKVEICHVDGRFFVSKSDSAYLENDARVFIQRSTTPSNSSNSEDVTSSESQNPPKNSKNPQKSWQFNSNLCPILAELVAILVEFGFADVFRIQMTSDFESQNSGVFKDSEDSETPTTSSSSKISKMEKSQILKKKALSIEEIPFENTSEFRTKRLVVRDFWKRGYYLTDGTRFGGNYLVYTASPNNCHAEFVLLCTPISDQERIAAMRCCNQVKKTLILATMSPESMQPHYTKCEWFRPDMF